MSEYTFDRGRKIFKFEFTLNPDRTPSQQMAQMKVAFDRAAANFFAGKIPDVIDFRNEPERY